MDGKSFEGHRLVVQHASNNFYLPDILVGRRRDRGERDRFRDRDYRRDDDRGRDGSRERYGRPFVKKRGPQEEDLCYNCGKAGHW